MRNRIPDGALIFAVVAAFLMAGCSNLGKENILFVTKTSVGVDFDVKPPTLVIGFDRKEGTIAPEFDSGAVLPQMASFTSDLGIINQAVGQSFATGNAALIMSDYFTATHRPVPPPRLKIDISKPAEIVTYGQRKRYFFGTDTSFAFKVGFGLETGGLPDSLSLGYKRKELAFIPLFEIVDRTDPLNPIRKVRIPSLLATAGLATVVDPKKPERTKVVHSQFFATGVAASYLALLPEIRATVALKIMPEAEEISEANLAAMARGKAQSEQRKSNIDRILGHVSPTGAWEAANKSKLTALFDDTDIDSSNKNRQDVEGAGSVGDLRELLGLMRPEFVAKLAAAIS